MNKIIFQAIITVMLFFGLWSYLSDFQWIELLQIEKISKKTEKELGNLMWKAFQAEYSSLEHEEVFASVDSLLTHLCEANNINRSDIKLHLLNHQAINAFAMPDGHIVVFSGLLTDAANQEEIAAVLAHELAHLSHGHVLQKLVKEIGLAVLISVGTGSNNMEIIRQMAKVLSSSAFDRRLEKQADESAVKSMIKAQLNPAPFADFLTRMSEAEGNNSEVLRWVSTHPDSEERAKKVLEMVDAAEGKKYISVISSAHWLELQKELRQETFEAE
ncbi:MAG: peptidase M48 [Sphingobacteriaceae bacterium]|nr:peptidase M48 [Sphingobacteriaceae bacterium]